MEAETYNDDDKVISRSRLRALDTVDRMPPGLRLCVHEFGLPVVNACLQRGIKNPRHIRQLVREIWEGARHVGQAKGGSAAKGRALEQLDWVLLQAGAEISALTLVRVLAFSDLVIVPRDPNKAMIEASLETVSKHREIMTKPEKHRRRLRAALDAAVKSLWPHLTDPNL